MRRVIGLLKAVVVVMLLVLPWAFLWTAASLVIDILVIVAVILLDAYNNRMVSLMAVRYALRRPATTALVVGGLQRHCHDAEARLRLAPLRVTRLRADPYHIERYGRPELEVGFFRILP